VTAKKHHASALKSEVEGFIGRVNVARAFHARFRAPVKFPARPFSYRPNEASSPVGFVADVEDGGAKGYVHATALAWRAVERRQLSASW
jgi:hypothetical protein